MRVGVNPLKDRPVDTVGAWHRIILPVFIPEENGYFQNSAAVLEACLDSILRTTGEETAVTVVVNGAGEKTKRVLEQFQEGCARADLIWRAKNAGKVEALFGAARGYHEPFVTMTDCDVLLRPGWLDRTMEIFARCRLELPHDYVV